MTGKSSAERLLTTEGTTQHEAGPTAARRGLRRLFARATDRDRSSRRAGAEALPVVRMTPQVWSALG